MDIIISLYQHWSEMILNEKKPLEFRKILPKNFNVGDTIYLYETKRHGGAGAIVGQCKLAGVINGLWSTRTHSDMFEYIPGDNIARLVPDVNRPGRIRNNVRLREDQIALLNRAIETKYFFNN